MIPHYPIEYTFSYTMSRSQRLLPMVRAVSPHSSTGIKNPFVNSNRNCKGRPADVAREAGGLSATRREGQVFRRGAERALRQCLHPLAWHADADVG